MSDLPRDFVHGTTVAGEHDRTEVPLVVLQLIEHTRPQEVPRPEMGSEHAVAVHHELQRLLAHGGHPPRPIRHVVASLGTDACRAVDLHLLVGEEQQGKILEAVSLPSEARKLFAVLPNMAWLFA